MRLLINLIMILLCLNFCALAQKPVLEKKVSVTYESIPLEKVLADLELRYNINFSYSSNIVALDKKVTIHAKNKPLKEVLDEIFSDMETAYQVIDDLVILKKGKKRGNTGSRNQLNGLEASSGHNVSLLSDTAYKKEKAVLGDSIKALKSEVQKLNRIIDSLIVNEDKTGADKPSADTSVAYKRDKKLLKTLRDEMNNLNTKIIRLLDKLNPDKDEQSQEEDSLNDTNVHYYVVVNVVPGKFRHPLIGLINIGRGSYKGFNLGYINLINGYYEGVQFGLLNIANGHTKGTRAGAVNIANGNEDGVSLGLVNINNGHYKGVRVGYINANMGDFKGFNGGFINYSHGNFKGTRLGYININAKNSDGITAGFINAAHKMNGLHIGFINVCDSVDQGAPIGFLSIVRNGYRRFEIGGSETFFAQGSFKIGVKKLYNIFSLVTNYSNDQFRWGYGYGIGTLVDLSAVSSFNIDLMAYDILENGHEFDHANSNMLYQLKVNYAKLLGPKLSFYIGPSFNVMVSTLHDSSKGTYGSEMPVWTISDVVHNNTSVKMWPGVNAGIRF